MRNNYCFVTGKHIPENAYCRFTWEWDAWVSQEGEQHIYNAAKTGELELNPEWVFIYNEWMTEDGSESNGKIG